MSSSLISVAWMGVLTAGSTQAPTAENAPALLVCCLFIREGLSPWCPPRRSAAALEVAGNAAAFGNQHWCLSKLREPLA